MLYAKVLLGLAVQGPFDYIIAKSQRRKVKVGSRVRVSFRTQRMVGYVVKITAKSSVKNLKPIIEVIDDIPVLDKNMLLLTQRLAQYYCCTWGQAIETALPPYIRKGKKLVLSCAESKSSPSLKQKTCLIHDLDGNSRWPIYFNEIRDALAGKRSVIILLPDVNSLLKAKGSVESLLGITPAILYREEHREQEEWAKIREGKASIVLGTRSCIFAPVRNLGLVIIDEEQDYSYKQDQVPHYHAREVAFMRAKLEGARLILGSSSPSLETIYLAKREKIEYLRIPRKRMLPEIRIFDISYERQVFKDRDIISRYLFDSIAASLNVGGKVLLFLNRKGFATLTYCHACGEPLKCPRCNINLVYHFKENILTCHYCNFKMQVPLICPSCNAGYIRYSGSGTEKIESELARLFPQARIKKVDDKSVGIEDADIFVATQYVIRQADYNFDLVAVLAIDNTINRNDFRAGEKAYRLLLGLLKLTDKKIIIQTRLPRHHSFQALVKADMDIFYDQELRERRQLGFPPYSHMALIKLRGTKESRVREASESLFARLNQIDTINIKIISLTPAQPPKLRGKFYWQILMQSRRVSVFNKFLKICLKDFTHSGIILTVDVEPV